eukprot:3043011-Pyramimonas_sp.AAC.1
MLSTREVALRPAGTLVTSSTTGARAAGPQRQGPARVLVREQRTLAGSNRPTSVVGISRGDVLLLRAPEQLRPAAEAERA